MKDSDNISIEKEILKRIKEQPNPNIRLIKHMKILKWFWIVSCLFSISVLVGLYVAPNLRKHLESDYSFLMYLPTLFVIIIIFLGFRFQEIKLIAFRKQNNSIENNRQ